MPGETTARQQMLNKAVALVFLLSAMCAGYIKIGLPPALIVGGSGVAAFALWQGSYLKRPSDPSVILPLFLLTVAALDVHMAEEYLTKFGPAMSAGITTRSWLNDTGGSIERCLPLHSVTSSDRSLTGSPAFRPPVTPWSRTGSMR